VYILREPGFRFLLFSSLAKVNYMGFLAINIHQPSLKATAETSNQKFTNMNEAAQKKKWLDLIGTLLPIQTLFKQKV